MKKVKQLQIVANELFEGKIALTTSKTKIPKSLLSLPVSTSVQVHVGDVSKVSRCGSLEKPNIRNSMEKTAILVCLHLIGSKIALEAVGVSAVSRLQVIFLHFRYFSW
jgi:hypothetical protein